MKSISEKDRTVIDIFLIFIDNFSTIPRGYLFIFPKIKLDHGQITNLETSNLVLSLLDC